MDINQINATVSSRARFERRMDLGLRYASGLLASPHWLKRQGVRRLLRWTGKKYPLPLRPATVGIALRPATSVAQQAGSPLVASTVHWYLIEDISGGGLQSAARGEEAQCVVADAGGVPLAALPNAPLGVQVFEIAGPKVELVWHHSPVGEQVAAKYFNVYGDGGTGTMDWLTPVATVDVVEGRQWYTWTSGTLSGGAAYRWNVRAASADDIESLAPLLADLHLGGDPDYLGAAGNGVGVTLRSGAPSDPTEIRFGGA